MKLKNSIALTTFMFDASTSPGTHKTRANPHGLQLGARTLVELASRFIGMLPHAPKADEARASPLDSRKLCRSQVSRTPSPRRPHRELLKSKARAVMAKRLLGHRARPTRFNGCQFQNVEQQVKLRALATTLSRTRASVELPNESAGTRHVLKMEAARCLLNWANAIA